MGGEPPHPLPVSEPAPAKVNLFLRVLGRRGDGFHDIETLIQPITLADGIRASHREVGFGLSIAGEGAAAVPGGPENLVLRAAEALAASVGERRGANLLLAKRVPVAAGLAGASADAAATLRALDRLWGWGLGVQGLHEVAASVGSDVPALLGGGPVVARGRGEVLEPAGTPRTWWAIVPLAFGIAARDAYGWWDRDEGPTGPDPSRLFDALRSADLQAVGRLLFNDLEGPVAARREQVGRVRDSLLEEGALGAVMCGSGPTVAALARDGTHATELAERVGGRAVSSMLGLPR